jgi:hypothetical protein
VVEPLLPQLLEVPLPVVTQVPQRRRPRRRKRVRKLIASLQSWMELTTFIEKEESDEDMGFGLFD